MVPNSQNTQGSVTFQIEFDNEIKERDIVFFSWRVSEAQFGFNRLVLARLEPGGVCRIVMEAKRLVLTNDPWRTRHSTRDPNGRNRHQRVKIPPL
ncbi:uncharacterized protein VTP21DRAFT_5087 [Calcarisporiella thermophila]|uniref:uncharacterized protein n=1 Tax=Calcarisporiella thermophila TaxID=911321 RepID=UPI003743C305